MTQNRFIFFDDGRGDNADASKPSAPRPRQRRAAESPSESKKTDPALTITQVTRMVKQSLAASLPSRLTVAGEISNCTARSGGHVYFTLKDADAQLPCVMWASAAERLNFRPADGMAVEAVGRIDVYEPHGKYQFYADRMNPTGSGDLDAALRRLAEQLRSEGLFDTAHKKPLPRYPLCIAIITSDTGAAVEDIVNTLNRRWPVAAKLLVPVRVQGDAAPGEIVAALKTVASHSPRRAIDVILLARGGGSLEDLWAFNDAALARAIFDCPIPVITGIGHEVDTTIADMVADCRAATPTAAAELAVPDRQETLAMLADRAWRLDALVRQGLDAAVEQLDLLARRSAFAAPARWVSPFSSRLALLAGRLEAYRPKDLIARHRRELDHQLERLKRAAAGEYRHRQRDLDTLSKRLGSVNPRAVLSRGYSITRDSDGHVIRPDALPPAGAALVSELADDVNIHSTVTGTGKRKTQQTDKD